MRRRSFDWDEAARMHGDGLSSRHIADALGVGKTAVSSALRRMGLASGRAGGENIPPTRLCLCGCVYAVHSRGFCGVCRRLERVECPEFTEDVAVPRLVGDGHWLAPLRRTMDGHRYTEKLAST